MQGFSKCKTNDFFWTQVSEGVKKAEYAVRGIVPTTAVSMKEQLDKKTKSTNMKYVRLSIQINYFL